VLDPDGLYELGDALPELDRPVLVQALTGFIDAGGARHLARNALMGTLPNELLVSFDVDQLFDYRARRPPMLFLRDHWESYDDPVLAIRLLRDTAGTPFLLLDGPEPDVQWERFTAAVRSLVQRLGVRLTVGLNAIPMAVPHTRPIGVTAHATRPELVVGHEPWVNAVQVPASAGHLLEYRLGQAGHDAVGFAVHVPHYVAQMEYPAAAVALLDATARATGLTLPSEDLRTASERVRADIEEQVAQSTDVAAVVAALESQYDAFVADRGRDGLLADGVTKLPTADELGAELERFLAQRARGGEPER
jgi:hypothetical protein